MPSASVASAIVVTPALRRSARAPYLMSCQNVLSATRPPPPGMTGSGLAGRSPPANARVKTSLVSSASRAARSASASEAPDARFSRYRSSRSSTISSTISRSRCGPRPSGASRRRTSDRHSGTFRSDNSIDGRDEGVPAAALLGENPPAGGGQAIAAPAAFAGSLDPAALNPAALLEPVEQGIERRDVEADGPARSLLDELGDVVS